MFDRQRSRYNYSRVVRVLGETGLPLEPDHIDSRPTLTRTQYSDNVQYTPNANDRWSRIAWQRYGDPSLYWVIADFSGIVDPHSELHPEETTSYVAQLGESLVANALVSKAKLTDVRQVTRGTKLRIEDLNLSNRVSIDVSVVDVDLRSNYVTFSPVRVPVTGIPWDLSRVSRVYMKTRTLTMPTLNRVFFEALRFSNPANVLSVP